MNLKRVKNISILVLICIIILMFKLRKKETIFINPTDIKYITVVEEKIVEDFTVKVIEDKAKINVLSGEISVLKDSLQFYKQTLDTIKIIQIQDTIINHQDIEIKYYTNIISNLDTIVEAQNTIIDKNKLNLSDKDKTIDLKNKEIESTNKKNNNLKTALKIGVVAILLEAGVILIK